MADGSPQCVPFYPHEFVQRQANLGFMDYSSLPVAEATVDDFDPLERERLRQMVERYGGDRPAWRGSRSKMKKWRARSESRATQAGSAFPPSPAC
jgi:hypothetical protein